MNNGTKENLENYKDSFKLTCFTCWLREGFNEQVVSFVPLFKIYSPSRFFSPEAKTRGGMIEAPAHIYEERKMNKNKYVFIYLEPNQKFSDYPVPLCALRNYPRSPCTPAFKSLSLCKGQPLLKKYFQV